MPSSSAFEPTFTQGLILGQFSIVVLLVLILRHLFFDSPAGRRLETPTYHPRLEEDEDAKVDASTSDDDDTFRGAESTVWFNLILRSVLDAYRSKLRDDLDGPDGDEIVRKRVEELANKMRPISVLDPIKIHAVDLGASSPRLSNARRATAQGAEPNAIELDLTYTDTATIALSSAVLVNFPKPGFARLPISLTISLALLASSVVVTPPAAGTPAPSLALHIPPTFTLELKTTSLLGSRAKLADVPKLHELVQSTVRRALAARGTWKVVLPGLASVAAVKEEVKREQHEGQY